VTGKARQPTDKLTHDLDIETDALGLGIDLPDIGAEGGPLFLQAFDSLDERAQPLGRDASAIGHGSPLLEWTSG
jgi:hypothetical protein